ncbi:MAG: response regulator [Mariprofundaceae bacterium]|nr:response regulator [Mariprofundaceae bacterium]
MVQIHIIEDDHFLLDSLMIFLNDKGYAAQGFISAETYIDYMNGTSFNLPELIISDVNLPGICGLQLANKVRQRYLGIRYILMTGNTEQLKRQHLLTLNIEQVLAKPFKFEAFEQALSGH